MRFSTDSFFYCNAIIWMVAYKIVCGDLLFFLRSWGTCCIQSWKGYFICSIINMDGGDYFIVIGVTYIIRQPFYIWILPQVQNVGGQFTVYQIHIWTNTVQTLCFNGISIHLLLNNLIQKKMLRSANLGHGSL